MIFLAEKHKARALDEYCKLMNVDKVRNQPMLASGNQ